MEEHFLDHLNLICFNLIQSNFRLCIRFQLSRLLAKSDKTDYHTDSTKLPRKQRLSYREHYVFQQASDIGMYIVTL